MAITTQMRTDVAGLYAALFGRAPERDGLGYWVQQLDAGKTVADVAQAMYNVDAARATYPLFLTNQEIIGKFYTNVLGRTADADGLAYWTAKLNGGATQGQVISDMITAVKAYAGTDAAALASQSLFNNKVSVGLNYAVTLGLNDVAQAAAVLNLVTATDTTAANNLASGVSTAGQTFTLTTGIDNFVGGAGNDTFNASNGDTTAGKHAFGALDSIDGGAGNDTLNVVDVNAISLAAGAVTVKNVETVNVTDSSTVTLNTTGWTGLSNLNVLASTGAGAITADATTAVSDTNTLATAAAAAAAINSSVDGGSTVTATVTGTNATGSAVVGNFTVGGTTAAAGNVTITATETAAVAGILGNIAATSTAGVTVNSTENFAIVNGSTAGTVSATGGNGAVSVTATTNVTETDNPLTAAGAITAGSISVKGGTSITVNEVATASAAALAAEVGVGHTLTVTQGAVTVQDGGTATKVTVNQTAAATAAAGTAATLATAATAAVAGIGYDATLAAAGTAATALVPATLGVVGAGVTVAGTTGTAAGNASNTITDVTLSNYGAASYINSNVLKNVTLSGAAVGGLTVYNQAGTAFTSLNANLNAFSDATGLTIGGNGVTTLNVTTGGASGSTLAAITDTSLKTLNIAGTQVLTLTTVPTAAAAASLASINVSGAAGFNDNGTFGGTAAATTLTTTSSGKITATLHAAGTDTFTGSTGQDVISLAADQTKAVTAGSATNDELILKGTAATFLGGATKTAANVSGFETLGINNAAANGTYDLSLLAAKNSISNLDVISGNGTTATFTNVAKGTSLSIDASQTTVTGAYVYQSADAQSATGNDTVTLNLGTATTTGITVGAAGDTGATAALSSLVMEDTNQVGIATLNVVSNGTAASAATANTIVALSDSGLSALNVSGTHGLTITTLNEGVTAGTTATAATTFAINNTSGGAVTIGTFTDSALGNLTFSGTGNSAITSLAGVTGQVLSITNSGTGTASIGTGFADANLKSLTLTGNVAIGNDTGAAGVATVAEGASFGTTGFTLAAGTDNAHINLNLTGAGAGYTDNLTVGNGNNYITDGSTAGHVNVTVGTGSNLIDLSAGGGVAGTTSANPTYNTTYLANVTLGTHTVSSGVGLDLIKVGAVNSAYTLASGTTGGNNATWSYTPTAAATVVVTGAAVGDKIAFAADGNQSALVTLSTAHQTAISAAADLATAINLAFTDINVDTGHAAHGVMAFTYGGNTYVIENVGADGTLNAGDGIVELVGIHTISQVTAAGAATIAIAS